MSFIKSLAQFTWQQVICCIFPGAIFIALAVTKYVTIPGVARYDLLLLICIFIQLALLYSRYETFDELKVILLFHIIGLVLEIFKIQIGSWFYPEAGFFKILGVPLYSGFMYSSIGSYICKAWKVFDLEVHHWPKSRYVLSLCLLIYANFFTHHFVPDIRWYLIFAVVVVFIYTKIYFSVGDSRLHMPMTAAFFAIGFFIWIAENIASFFSAWAYPDQLEKWTFVHLGKITSWFLLIIISIMLVVELKKLKLYLQKKEV